MNDEISESPHGRWKDESPGELKKQLFNSVTHAISPSQSH